MDSEFMMAGLASLWIGAMLYGALAFFRMRRQGRLNLPASVTEEGEGSGFSWNDIPDIGRTGEGLLMIAAVFGLTVGFMFIVAAMP